MRKIMVSAGEVSGDIHGTHLVREIKRLDPNIYFFGMGSEKLLAEGVDIKVDITKRGTVGIFEAIPNIIPVYLAYKRMASLLRQEKPDLLILIDSQGINMPLAKAAKKLGIKTTYYIAPQEWLWGTERGVKKVSETIDLIISIFEQEHKAYKRAGGKSVYFGHPLIDIVRPELTKEETISQFIGKASGPIISLCPGSRPQEIKGLFPILLKAGELIQKEIPNAKFLIPAASTGMIKEIFNLISEDFRPKAVVGHTYDILAASDLAICTSGTINLEASILDTPNIMVYKLHPLTYWLGKYVLKLGEKLKYFSMPNMLLDERVIPELVMRDANPSKIAATAMAILKDKKRQEQMKTDFVDLKLKLGQPGVISRCAEAVTALTLDIG
ncbi:lipid-A-disaccharide synthase [candidate division WOR-1 bacterium RIFCSPLOWO2_02_FULL_46_20]|uniref:Lipid-A-disaccharide synthase n=2 Tax=Saganbacteria TaxID=1703751 RepID=A0A1F4RFM1_UNCSA|nr:MAG: lipid-A-disaccharide synthase [candidate division WOR-1 bacterium RIFCSPLOWO2_02_FULL_46_20]OGC09498.1 MAG: lipid-A-disaccharide synthase [candidate division WOR-1 bacterium RIFCSPLOWO2_12_FULL_45_9]